jgi:Secretion system C-terminal sorting domain
MISVYLKKILSEEKTMKIIRILLLASIFLCSFCAQLLAQQQYLGGNGGGYSSVTSEDLVLAIEDVLALGTVPEDFQLYQNYPNPFNPTTKISYSISESDFVSLKIHDLLGREIYSLINEHQAANTYNINFNAPQLSSGIYFYRLTAGRFTETKKLILMK